MNQTNGEFSVELNGINHWVKIEGSENNTTPLIILHGGPGGNHYVFERTAGPLLSKTRTVVYYEQRGCGRTDRPTSENEYSIELLISDFIELKNWLAADKVDLLGYSFGGELALEISYALPQEVNQVIVSAPSLMNTEIQKLVQITGILSVASSSLYNKIFEQGGTGIDELYDRIWNLADPDTVDALLFENQEIARKNREWWEESKLVNTGLLAANLQKNQVEKPLIFRLEEIQNPVLILTGAYDRNTGIPISKIIERNLPDSRMVIFENSAHFPDLEETEKFVEVIAEFLER
ncbi:alpha/beta fold hydrolase [Bacillus salacetis]|uniref:alpha/beta fold hydrolase n=1 Tax=Bacillus salacetis TaxID=2315464 RepID=UPI003BA162A7